MCCAARWWTGRVAGPAGSAARPRRGHGQVIPGEEVSGLGASHPSVYRKCRAVGVATLGLSLSRWGSGERVGVATVQCRGLAWGEMLHLQNVYYDCHNIVQYSRVNQ